MKALLLRVGALFGLLSTAVVSWTASAAVPTKPSLTARFGVIAEEPNEPDHMFTVYSPLLAELRQRLASAGIAVSDLVIARDLDDLSQRIARKHVDFVLESVFPTLSLRQRSRNLEPALLVVRRGQREYRSVFFTRQESPIRSLVDLRGRTLVLQAIRSTSAFALPRAELRRAGLRLVAADDAAGDPGAVRYVLALAEVNQAVWVLHEKGDAGAFNEGDWEALPEKIRARLRIFERSQPIQRGVIAFRGDLAPATRRAIEDVMLALHRDEAGLDALTRAGGITRFERLTRASTRRCSTGPRCCCFAPSLMRKTSIGTRYAAYVAALALALVVVALLAAGAIALSQMRVVQAELREAVAGARVADDERALDGARAISGCTCSTRSTSSTSST
jgi:phosphonate transport system substrate-binding protein